MARPGRVRATAPQPPGAAQAGTPRRAAARPGEDLDRLRFGLRYLRVGLSARAARSGPLFLTFFATARCPLACGHCLCGPPERRSPAAEELSLAEIECLAERLPPIPKLLLTGGEPFVREDLVQIAEALRDGRSRCRQITIPSSGWHPERIAALVDRLCGGDPRLLLEIQLSIDGVEERHDAVRGAGSFARLLATWEALRARERAWPGLRVRFNFTFSAVTQRDFPATYHYVTRVLGCERMDMVLLRGQPADPRFAAPVDLDRYRRAARLLRALDERRAGRGLVGRLEAARAELERAIAARQAAGESLLRRCGAGSLIAVIDERGTLRPCELLATSFGNLRERDLDFAALWDGEAARNHRAALRRRPCTCTFESAVRCAASFEPRWVLAMLRGALSGDAEAGHARR